MKDILAEATIIEKGVSVNSGFLHITDSSVDGIFTFDYINIRLDKGEMLMDFYETSINEGCIKNSASTFKASYLYEYLYFPDEYTLSDGLGRTITLFVEDVINDSEIRNLIISKINSSKVD